MKEPEALDELAVPAAEDVTLEDLSFAYGDEPVFSGLSITACPSDIIGVTGPVACGKSTFGRVFLCEAPYGARQNSADGVFRSHAAADRRVRRVSRP